MTFPDDYPADEPRRARTATFAVTVKAVKTAGETKIDDEFAKSLGLQSLDQLQGPDPRPAEQELNGLTRTHMKRQLLDQLAARHDFAVPESMVEAEYQNIMQPASPRSEPRGRPEGRAGRNREATPTNIARSPSAACASACCCRKSAPPTASRSASRK